ncbi:MAG: hypothetical protein KIT22_08590 [Verrucomicrobiae bacterium]|nr:hypothetical protein [Verrucomicrobiae bacterium]
MAVSKFSKLFPDLPGLAVSEEEAAVLGGPGGLMHDYDDTSPDGVIPSGYTFFAQFVDHDITLDTTSKLRGAPLSNDEIAKLPNLRSPSLDLDCVYGFGPDGSPHLYDPGLPGRMATHPGGYDLARSPAGVALIGDPRNDENLFVSQLQLVFLQFHNKMHNERVHGFEEAQRETRWHYQWIVLFDFLKRLCDRDVYKWAVPKILACDPDHYPIFFKPDAHGELTMPVEFSVAAYRVGHTMVRSVYAVNEKHREVQLFDEEFGTLGFSALPEELAVNWSYLLPVCECTRPLMSKAIDPMLTDELQNLPIVPSRNPLDRALAFRNLMRGNALSLSSGQAVAQALATAGYPVNPAFDLKLGEVRGWKRLASLPREGPSLEKQTPLFYYILRESEVKGGKRLGPVGSAILLEVFGGMLVHCGTSFLSREKTHPWNPDPCVSKEKVDWWSSSYENVFDRHHLVEDCDYFPLELADVVRFLRGRHCG